MTYSITQRISPKLSGEVLDEIVANFQLAKRPAHWRPGYELSSSIKQFIERAIHGDEAPSPARVWSWLKLADDETGYSSEQRQPVRDWLAQHPALRRGIQRIALDASNGGEGPWIVIVHDLPSANRGLALSIADTAELLNEIGSKDDLSDFDIQLWADLVRSQQSASGFSEEIRSSVLLGKNRHPMLGQRWEELIAPSKRDWRKEEQDRKLQRKQDRERKFAVYRASFWPLREKIAAGQAIGALKQFANAYMGRYSDLDRGARPDDRIQELLGEELAVAALGGFVSALSRQDIPSAAQIAKTHIEGKHWTVEPVLICGIAELVRLGQPLNSISKEMAMSALAAWWETPDANSDRLGEGVRDQLEDFVFSSKQSIEEFLSSVVEPHIREGNQNIPGLYRMHHEGRLRSIIGNTSVRWLSAYPNANSAVQMELLQIAIEHGLSTYVRPILRERVSNLQSLETSTQHVRMSAAFLVDFENSREIFTKFFKSDRTNIWTLGELIRKDRHDHGTLIPISIRRREFIVLTFGDVWPPVPRPSSRAGDTNPWNASDFIRGMISAIGADPAGEASASLDRLMSYQDLQPYFDHIKHTRAQQLRLRRDTEFRVPTFEQIKQTLAGGLPGNIDDLKAMVMDRLEKIQNYIRNSDTHTWEAFWNDDKPKIENICRDRLLDQLRPEVPLEINLLPEITMPEANRVDIIAIYRGYGLPIEIKGQWHPEAWNAASVQLIEKYARDWRADDRGIYLVLWFGSIPGKNLPKHPESLPLPSSPNELREMLVARLASAERARIDVFVLDVSKPKRQ